MQYTNNGLVKHAKNALGLKTVYMYGGILRTVEQQYDMLQRIYGNQSGTGYSAERWNYLKSLFGKGYYGVDCVGLIKSYYWSGKLNGGVGSPNYGAAGYPDVNAGGMYAAAKVKGKIDTMPERPGIIVYCRSHPHVGVYIGNGYTIESTLGSRGDGVVKRKLDNLWEYWFECPYIKYIKKNDKITTISTKTDFVAAIREKPTYKSAQIGRLDPGTNITYIKDSDTLDPVSQLIYVRLSEKLNGKNQWILKQTLHGGA